MTYHIRSDGKKNHLFDDDKCVCTGKTHDPRDKQYRYVIMNKLDVARITCQRCLKKVNDIVKKELGNVIDSLLR
jgi:hypothetical protein